MDISYIIKSIRELKILVKLTLEDHQIKLMQFDQRNLLSSDSSSQIKSESLQLSNIPNLNEKKLINISNYSQYLEDLLSNFENSEISQANSISQVDLKLFKEVLSIDSNEVAVHPKPPVCTADSQINMVADGYEDNDFQPNP